MQKAKYIYCVIEQIHFLEKNLQGDAVLEVKVSSISSWTSMTNNRHLSELESEYNILPNRPIPICGTIEGKKDSPQHIMFMAPENTGFLLEKESYSPKNKYRENFIYNQEAPEDTSFNFESASTILADIFLEDNKISLLKLKSTTPEKTKELLSLEAEFFRELKRFTGRPPYFPADILYITYEMMLGIIRINIEYILDDDRSKLYANLDSLGEKILTVQASKKEKPASSKKNAPYDVYLKVNKDFNSSEFILSNLDQKNNIDNITRPDFIFEKINNKFDFNKDSFKKLWPFLRTAPTGKHILTGKVSNNEEKEMINFTWKRKAHLSEIEFAREALNKIWERSEFFSDEESPFTIDTFSAENIEKIVLSLVEKSPDDHSKNYYQNIALNMYI